MAVNDQTLAIERASRAAIDQITDDQTRDMVEAWARGWQSVQNDLERAAFDLARDPQAMAEFQGLSAQGPGTLHPGIGKARAVRLLAQAAEQAGQQLSDLLTAAGVRVTPDIAKLVAQAEAYQGQMIAAQFPSYVPWDWTRVRPGDLAAIVARTTQTIHQRLWVLSDSAEEALKRSLVAGMGQGANPRDVARRMIELTEGDFNGGLRRAVVLARTEQLDAYRAASLASRAANADVLAGWEWICHFSPRTCRSCLSKHGSVHPLDEPGPDDHQQGRCTAVPVTKSWADLGFKGIAEPPSATPDAEAWLRSQTRDVQNRILTARGREAWESGDYPIGDWSQLRHTPEWRDSYAPSTPPKRGE